MTTIRGDASDFYRVAADLSAVGAKAIGPLREAMLAGGTALADQWKANAEAIQNGRTAIPAFPGTIIAKPVFGVSQVAVDVTPEGGGQAKLGGILEHGGAHSPPYLLGLKAMDAVGPKVEALVDAAVGHLF